MTATNFIDLLGGIAALIYLLYVWLQLRNMKDDGLTNRHVIAIILPATVIHLIYALLLLRITDGLYLSLWSSAVVVMWVASVATFYLHLVQGYRILALVITPITILVLLCAMLFSSRSGVPIVGTNVLIHVVISMLAYAVLALAALQAVAILVLHRSLKKHVSTTFIKLMPPLQRVESTSMYLLWMGVSFLTVSVATGFTLLWEELAKGNYWTHMAIAVACWVVYLGLVSGQLWFGWRGQTSSRLSLTAFALLVIGYLGLRIVFDFGV